MKVCSLLCLAYFTDCCACDIHLLFLFTGCYSIPVCDYTTVSSSHPLVMGIRISSSLGLLLIVTLHSCMYPLMITCTQLWGGWGYKPKTGAFDSWNKIVFSPSGCWQPGSTWVLFTLMPAVSEFHLHPWPQVYFGSFSFYWYHIMLLVSISLITSAIEHRFLDLVSSGINSFGLYISYWFVGALYVFWVWPLCQMYGAYPLNLSIMTLGESKLFILMWSNLLYLFFYD